MGSSNSLVVKNLANSLVLTKTLVKFFGQVHREGGWDAGVDKSSSIEPNSGILMKSPEKIWQVVNSVQWVNTFNYF